MRYILLENGNGRTQREFIEIVAKINGIEINFTPIDEESMIVASHDSINGNYDKFTNMFNNCAKSVTKQEQRENVEKYILDKNLKSKIYELINK